MQTPPFMIITPLPHPTPRHPMKARPASQIHPPGLTCPGSPISFLYKIQPPRASRLTKQDPPGVIHSGGIIM